MLLPCITKGQSEYHHNIPSPLQNWSVFQR
jgi:hypothetical protein